MAVCEEQQVKLLCIGSLPYKHKIVIAGNHELSFEDKFLQQESIIRVKFDPKAIRDYMQSKNITKMKHLLANCTYLEDSETMVFGLRVYGCPWYVMIMLVLYFLLYHHITFLLLACHIPNVTNRSI